MKKSNLIYSLVVIIFFINLVECRMFHPKYIQQLAAGYAFGAVGWCIGTTLGYGITQSHTKTLRYGYFFYGAGSSFGVYWAGNVHDKGKYWPSLIGTIIFPMSLSYIRKELNIKSGLLNEFIGFSLPIGGFLGYNLYLLFKKKN